MKNEKIKELKDYLFNPSINQVEEVSSEESISSEEIVSPFTEGEMKKKIDSLVDLLLD